MAHGADMTQGAADLPSSLRIRGCIRLLRPKQWVKNAFVLAPLMFTAKFMDAAAIGNALLACFLFCVASSATYIVNDIYDVESDRRHPRKSKSRPIAAGIVSVRTAGIILSVLYLVLIAGAFVMPRVAVVLAAYLVLTLAYTLFLKHQPVIDIFTIAIGFVLRVYAGATALDVPVSGWMFVTTLSLALYLAAVKRRQELMQGGGSDGRRVLASYSVALVNRYAEMSSTGALLFYSLFVMSTKPQLLVTIPLVLFGVFRYWYVVEELDGGESPTDAVLSDWQMLATGLLWVAVCAWTLWPAHP